jgi:hypothetical protein
VKIKKDGSAVVTIVLPPAAAQAIERTRQARPVVIARVVRCAAVFGLGEVLEKLDMDGVTLRLAENAVEQLRK